MQKYEFSTESKQLLDIYITFAHTIQKKMRFTLQCTSLPKLRFRQWNRRRYAAFASIGRCVTIGHLHHDVANRALDKQISAGTAASLSEHDFSDFNDNPYEDTKLERKSPPRRQHHPDGDSFSGHAA